MTGQGLDSLVGRLSVLVTEARTAEPERVSRVVHRPEATGVSIERVGDVLVVHGRAAHRAVALSDITTPNAIEYVRNRLTSLGVDKALRRAGARQGDTVQIGSVEFEYEENLLA
jgi:GTP-binding protein